MRTLIVVKHVLQRGREGDRERSREGRSEFGYTEETGMKEKLEHGE